MSGSEALLLLVVGGNVLAVLAWFLLSGLKRGHEGAVRALKGELVDMRARADGGEEARAREFAPLADALDARLDEALDRGPLAGRRGLVAAQGELIGLCARFPELAP